MTATESLRDLWGLWGVEKTEGGQVSMISSQCDKLRETADRLDGIADISTPWIHRHLTPMLRDAADLILELRDDLQRVNAENAKLIVKLNAEHIVRQNVEIENARLRELVKYAYECAIHSDHATCDDCERINGCCILVDRMRELGIEAKV